MKTKRNLAWLFPLVMLVSLFFCMNVWAYSGTIEVAEASMMGTSRIASAGTYSKYLDPGQTVPLYISVADDSEFNAEIDYDIKFEAFAGAQSNKDVSVVLSRSRISESLPIGLVGYDGNRKVYQYNLTVKSDVAQERIGLKIYTKKDNGRWDTAPHVVYFNINTKVNAITIIPDGADAYAQNVSGVAGQTLKFKAKVDGIGKGYESVEWTLRGGSNPRTQIIGAAETGKSSTCEVQIGDETAGKSLVLTASTYSYAGPQHTKTLVKSADVFINVARVPIVNSVYIQEESYIQLDPGTTKQFTAKVNVAGGASEEVTWSLSGERTSTATQISASGELTVGKDEKSKKFTVKAVSVQDTTKSASLTVHVAHEWELDHVKTPSTCKEKGIGIYICLECGVEDPQSLPLSDQHTFGAAVVTKEATKTAPGEKTATCSVCGEKKVAAYELAVGSVNIKEGVVKLFADDTAQFVQAAASAVKVTVPATVSAGGKTYKVTSIGAYAFKNCKNLKSIKIGKSITEIGAFAFKGCKKLQTLEIKTTKLTDKTVDPAAFKGMRKAVTVKVPAKKLKAYKALFVKCGMKKSVKVTK